MELERNRIRVENKYFIFFCIFSFLFFFFVQSSSAPTCLDRRCLLSAKAEYFQEFVSPKMGIKKWLKIVKRRNLSGPGSSPPRCTSKCGKCFPCKAVHVPVPPGTPVTTEYYPEAWRCKCHNKLFIP